MRKPIALNINNLYYLDTNIANSADNITPIAQIVTTTLSSLSKFIINLMLYIIIFQIESQK